jgi:S-adenosylmethionine:tRNA ribosyltransferase-isomerase
VGQTKNISNATENYNKIWMSGSSFTEDNHMDKKLLTLADFDFELPQNLVAQEPIPNRDISRLLVIKGHALEQSNFKSIVDFFNPGDVLVLNDTKVIKSRIFVIKNSKQIELFFHQQLEPNLWQAFAKPAKKIAIGDVFELADAKIIVIDKLCSGEIVVRVQIDSRMNIWDFFEQHGKMPLPPYIKRSAESYDDSSYQTVFAANPGSVAAPTAGLHFTEDLLNSLKNKGVKICYITLHVGAGTFIPIKAENIESHQMHYENYSVTQETAELINNAIRDRRNVIAVGTTTLRTLESCCEHGLVIAKTANTNIFIKPGFNFQIADMLITNFHLPKSTLLLLVSAFAGLEEIKNAYAFAISNNFRFFSYGDANLIYKKTNA